MVQSPSCYDAQKQKYIGYTVVLLAIGYKNGLEKNYHNGHLWFMCFAFHHFPDRVTSIFLPLSDISNPLDPIINWYDCLTSRLYVVYDKVSNLWCHDICPSPPPRQERTSCHQAWPPQVCTCDQVYVHFWSGVLFGITFVPPCRPQTPKHFWPHHT